MPVIQSLSCGDDFIEITTKKGGVRRLTAADLPSGGTIAQREAQAQAWLDAHMDDVKIYVHVLSLSPLRVQMKTTDLGTNLASDWWMKP